jgi:hypothetical protein
VIVTWYDIQQHDGPAWQKVKKAQPAKVVSTGWLVHEDDDCVVLAQAWHEGESFGNWTYPKGCIRDIREIQ